MVFSLSSFIQFEYPEYLWIALPLFILAIILIFFRFLQLPKEEQKINRRLKLFITFTRIILISLLVVALCGPFYSQETISEGDPTIMLLVDNSTSMSLFSTNNSVNVEELKQKLEEKIPVSTVTIASGKNSRLGDAIFRQLQDSSLLLVTDGNNAEGSMKFTDLAAYAEKFNTTINAVELGDEHADTAIKITGPKSGIVETEYYFSVV